MSSLTEVASALSTSTPFYTNTASIATTFETLRSLPTATILSTSTPLPTASLPNELSDLDTSIKKGGGGGGRGGRGGGKGGGGGGYYIPPNAITGSGRNKTALLWPDFETCKGTNFIYRTGNCYNVRKYSRNDQIVGIVFWGIFVGILGCVGVVIVVAILVAILKCMFGS